MYQASYGVGKIFKDQLVLRKPPTTGVCNIFQYIFFHCNVKLVLDDYLYTKMRKSLHCLQLLHVFIHRLHWLKNGV